MSVKRIYVEKKAPYAVKAAELKEEIASYLGISTVTGVRELIRYDVENLSDDIFEKAVKTIFSEPPVDNVSYNLPKLKKEHVFATEYLPGQFDQRADSCEQCIQLLTQGERPRVRSAKIYILEGDLNSDEFEKIKAYVINPVE